MTDMTQALQKAGLTVPHNKRIWMWLKDHPGKTAKEISLALKLSPAIVYTLLADMEKRRMIQSGKENLCNTGTKFCRKTVKIFTAVGREFELLPVPKRKPRVINTPIPEPVVKLPILPSPTRSKISLEDLSLMEAKDLYEQLKKIFG